MKKKLALIKKVFTIKDKSNEVVSSKLDRPAWGNPQRGYTMSTATQAIESCRDWQAPRLPSLRDLENLLEEIGNNPAFREAQARGTIMHCEYSYRASLAYGGDMAKGENLVELLQNSLFRLTLNGAYDRLGNFTPWNVLAQQYA